MPDPVSWPLDETSQPVELLLSVEPRRRRATLGAQIEEQLRRAIREGALRPGAQVPSTRDLARQLGVSRRVAVDAYAQLAAEGYLSLRQGARPRVSDAAPSPTARAGGAAAPAGARPRFDFRPSVPDVSTFPRAAWLRSLREALATITDADLGYGDPRGVDALRPASPTTSAACAASSPTPCASSSPTATRRASASSATRSRPAGARRIALEDPSNPEQTRSPRRAGLEPVPIAVDEHGLRVDALERADADAVVLTPAHQHPTGVVLTGERRAAAARPGCASTAPIAIEDDYDAEYRYDRAAVGALQGLDPDRVVYAGSASKTLAPALRLGWLVVPPRLLERRRAREAARRPRHRADRAARVRRLPGPRRARPPPAPHAARYRAPPRRAGRGARRRAAGRRRSAASPPDCT